MPLIVLKVRGPRRPISSTYALCRIFLIVNAGVEYVVAMGTNPVLAPHAEPFLAPLRSVVAGTHDAATSYGEAAYHTRSWPAPRRTIIKAEVVWHHGRESRDNPRFVITSEVASAAGKRADDEVTGFDDTITTAKVVQKPPSGI